MSYFHEPKASANTAYKLNNIAIFHDECNKWFILYLIYFTIDILEIWIEKSVLEIRNDYMHAY